MQSTQVQETVIYSLSYISSCKLSLKEQRSGLLTEVYASQEEVALVSTWLCNSLVIRVCAQEVQGLDFWPSST